MDERRRETEKEREIDREREGGVKEMCQNCIPTMNMNTLCPTLNKSDMKQ